jgi:hypothetical protein
MLRITAMVQQRRTQQTQQYPQLEKLTNYRIHFFEERERERERVWTGSQ